MSDDENPKLEGYPEGHVHGDYTFGPVLGQGAFGMVQLGRHNDSDVKCAIKLVDKACLLSMDDVERVYRETFILTKLRHANVIRLYECANSYNYLMIVMEYAGTNLFITFEMCVGALIYTHKPFKGNQPFPII